MGKETGFSDKNSFLPDHTAGFVIFAFCDLHFAESRAEKQTRKKSGAEITDPEFSPFWQKGGKGHMPSKSCLGFFDRGIDGKTAGFLKSLEFIAEGRRSDDP